MKNATELKPILHYKEFDLGIPFKYRGDHIWWLWPWKRKHGKKWLSLSASGTGEFGDVCFHSLADLDKYWEAAMLKTII